MIENYIATGIINSIALLLLGYMVCKNGSLDARKRKTYVTAAAITGIIILAETVTAVSEFSAPAGRYWSIAGNILGFSLSPLIPILLALVFNQSYIKIPHWVLIPAAVNFAAVVLSPAFDLIFSVSPENSYSRGSLFGIYIAAYVWGILVLLCAIFRLSGSYYSSSRFLIPVLAVFLIVGTSIQVFFPPIHTTWTTVTFALVIYYAFICEFCNQHDILTSLLNRRAFENAKQHYQKYPQTVIVLFDVDKFKQVNDSYGHQYGDHCLNAIGMSINQAFSGVGDGFRIGGDEFGVFCGVQDEHAVDAALEKMQKTIEGHQKRDAHFPSVTFGYTVYHKATDDLERKIQEADEELYRCKQGK